MISETTSQKLKTISKILNNLVFGKLFENNNLTPFNWYIIEKMPKLIEFFNKISNVSLPSFINFFLFLMKKDIFLFKWINIL